MLREGNQHHPQLTHLSELQNAPSTPATQEVLGEPTMTFPGSLSVVLATSMKHLERSALLSQIAGTCPQGLVDEINEMLGIIVELGEDQLVPVEDS